MEAFGNYKEQRLYPNRKGVKISTKLSKRDKEDIQLSFIISLVVLCMFLITTLARSTEAFGISITLVSNVSNILKIILGCIFLSGIKIIINRLYINSVMFVLVSTILVLFNILFFPENNEYFSSYVTYLYITIIPLFVYITAIDDYRFLMNTMIKMSYFISAIAITFFVLSYTILNVSHNYRSYSMSFSYSCLLPSMILIRNYVDRKALSSLLLALGLILVIIVYGSRGPVLCLLVYSFILFLRTYLYKEKNKYMLVFIVLAVIGFFALSPILSALNSILDNLNIHSRVVDLLLQDDIEMSGRDIIYSRVLTEFLKAPLNIRGISSDFLLVGVYTHNLFLELLYEFGLFIATPMIIVILYYSLRTIFNKKITPYSEYCTILFSIALPQLMVSSSLWGSMYFWMWFALMLKYKNENSKS